MDVRIERFRAEHGLAFASLNLEWLKRYNLLEPPDEEQLADPERYFVTGGGQVLVALDGDDVVGTCAATPHGNGEFEIAKLAVSAEHRGRGLRGDSSSEALPMRGREALSAMRWYRTHSWWRHCGCMSRAVSYTAMRRRSGRMTRLMCS